MFTGIVQDVGRVEHLEARGGDVRLVISCNQLDTARLNVGDSICVQGCCLTAVELQGRSFTADVSRETLALTTLGALTAGSSVNLESALRAGDALGGHLVSGHVDGVAQVLSVTDDARSRRLVIGVPAPLARYVAPKGSVAVDGVSLTVNEVADGELRGEHHSAHAVGHDARRPGRRRPGQPRGRPGGALRITPFGVFHGPPT